MLMNEENREPCRWMWGAAPGVPPKAWSGQSLRRERLRRVRIPGAGKGLFIHLLSCQQVAQERDCALLSPCFIYYGPEGSSAHRFAAPLFPCRRTCINPPCPHLWGHRADGTPHWGWERVPKPSPNSPKGSVNPTDQRCSSAPGFYSADTSRKGGDQGPPTSPLAHSRLSPVSRGEREGEGDPAAGRTGEDGEAEGLEEECAWEEERQRGWGQDGAG